MAKSFKVMIVTPDKIAYEGDAISAVVPGVEGYLGVWANHAPLVGAVAPGLVSLKLDSAGSEKFFSVGTGFVEISDNVVNIMTDTCEFGDEIDADRAEKSLTRGRERLATVTDKLDRERARTSIARAQARISAKGR
ncbi:MAG: F-type H+-transporting ATPase subunit epsilon [Candidatus Krumholzibacteriia bacterium]|jgi:F-type H+-transporting ATPase subunit epsilon